MDKNYLISWLHRVLWNDSFLIKLFFELTAVSGTLLFKKFEFFQNNYTFSQELLYHKIIVFQNKFSTACLIFTITFSIYNLVVNPNNNGSFRLRLPEDAQTTITGPIQFVWRYVILEVALQKCSSKKVFLKFRVNLQEKTHAEKYHLIT